MSTREDDPARSASDPFLWRAIGVVTLFTAMLPGVIALTIVAYPELPVEAQSPWAVEAAALGVEPVQLEIGEATFQSTCAVCHGQDAEGIKGLGKPLRNSEYVQSQSDEALVELISMGRPPADPENTTGVAMPARANNPALNEQRMLNVVHYLRTLQDPDAPPVSMDDWVVAAADGEGGDRAAGATSAVGHDVFVASCSACHGPSGEGIEGLGKPLADSPFVESKTDEELIAFIKSGRPIWDPENTTGIDMPPKGGNPALTDEDLKTIVSYLRALHGDSGGGE